MNPLLQSEKVSRYVASVSRWQSEASRAVVDLLFPPRCPISDDPVAHHGTISPKAWLKLRKLAPPWCAYCGYPFEFDQGEQALCATCAAPDNFAEKLTGKGKLDQIRAALHYDDHISKPIMQLKYADRLDGVSAFGKLMTQAGQDLLSRPEVLLIPVPLHPSRLRSRRFNQAGLLATSIARHANVSVDHLVLRRSRKTSSQKGGSRTTRMKNVAGAFQVKDPQKIEGKSIILVDDVLTTGATLISCARALRKAGAPYVSALTLARVIKGQVATL